MKLLYVKFVCVRKVIVLCECVKLCVCECV